MDDGGEGGGEGGDGAIIEGARRDCRDERLGGCLLGGSIGGGGAAHLAAGRVGSRTTSGRAASPALSTANANCAKPAGPNWKTSPITCEINQQLSNGKMETRCAVPGYDK